MPVSTISFGTDYGTIEMDGTSRQSVAVDDEAMRRDRRAVGRAVLHRGQRDRAAAGLQPAGEQIGYEMRKVDASRPWLAGGALLLVVGVGAGIGLGRRLP